MAENVICLDSKARFGDSRFLNFKAPWGRQTATEAVGRGFGGRGSRPPPRTDTRKAPPRKRGFQMRTKEIPLEAILPNHVPSALYSCRQGVGRCSCQSWTRLKGLTFLQPWFKLTSMPQSISRSEQLLIRGYCSLGLISGGRLI